MDLQPEPLKKEIFDKARELGITEIRLEFQGGNDEGYVYVNCVHPDRHDFRKFQQEIEDWVWQVYDYSGAGDSTDYGDNIAYKIVEAVFLDGAWKIPTTSQDWFQQHKYGEKVRFEMGLQSEENQAMSPLGPKGSAVQRAITALQKQGDFKNRRVPMEPRAFLEDLKEEIQNDLICIMDSQFGEVEYAEEAKNLLCQAVVDRISSRKLYQKHDNKIISTHALKNGQVLMVIENQITGSVNIAVSVPNMPTVVSYYLCELSEQGVLSYANTGEVFSRLFDDENDHEKGGE